MPLMGSLDTAEEGISELEDIIETSETEQKRKKDRKKMEHNTKELQDNYKKCNIYTSNIRRRKENRSNIQSNND